ncbi:MAG: hypothetical protein WC373_01770 [Smithella sp.]|jgi:hypothetical protein
MRPPEKFRVGETLKSDIGPKLNHLVDFVISLVPHGDRSTILVKETPFGRFFSLLHRGGASAGSSSSSYSGPFAVKKKTDTTVTVLGATTTEIPAYIILGLDRIEYTEADVTITATGWVYLTITYSSPNYAVVGAFAAAIPAQDNTHIYHPLAYVTFAESKITSVTQIWSNGIIHFTGRAL